MEELNQTLSLLDGIQNDLTRVQTLRDSAVSRLRQVEDRVMILENDSDVLDRVSDLFRVLIDREVIENASAAEELLTEGLRAIFDDLDLSVRSEVEILRGKVSVDLITVQKHADGTITEGTSVDAYGGAVATVQSILLRIVVLFRRGLRPLLLLDESLGAVAEKYVPQTGNFLNLLCERMGLDLLAVSHNPALVEAANQAYRVNTKKGEATFKRIRS